jgi:uncharacterized protein
MNENKRYFTLNGMPPILQLFFSLVIILIVGTLLFYLLLGLCSLILDIDLATLVNSISPVPGERNVVMLRLLMIAQDISLFIVPGIIILMMMRPPLPGNRLKLELPHYKEVVMVIILGFCIFPVTSFTGQINSEMHLPEWLLGVEKWMIEKEDLANGAIDLLVTSHTFGIMILNILIVAVLPAIGEELIFRGVFQKILSSIFRSGHLSIWFTAFMFSALHLQFFGFIPRFILGLVFGYLYFWSGTLWLPVISHFVNNAVPVVMAFLQGIDKLNVPTEIPLWKQALGLPVPVFISLVILIYFRNSRKTINPV